MLCTIANHMIFNFLDLDEENCLLTQLGSGPDVSSGYYK